MRWTSWRTFTWFFLALSLALFSLLIFRAWYIPITHDEASTFFFYVQTGNYIPYKAHAYTNNHVLNSMLSSWCYNAWGAHPFVLRLPNLIAFPVYCLGLYLLARQMQNVWARFALVALFLLIPNLTDFFALCRGYGISLACMLFGIYWLLQHFSKPAAWRVALFFVSWHLALAANMTLIVPLALLTFFLTLHLVHKWNRRRWLEIVWILFSLFLLAKWIKFALYYRSLNLLDSGSPTDLYTTTFVSLMELMHENTHLLVQLIYIAVFVFSVIHVFLFFWKKPELEFVYTPLGLSFCCFLGLVVMIVLQNWVLLIYFPDNRAALFFYLFFALMFCFVLDRRNNAVSQGVGALLFISHIFYMLNAVNFTHFRYPFYHTMPDSFMDYLVQRQKQSELPITVGGHINREMNYTFANYQLGSPLNPMHIPSRMEMNCDYYYARSEESVYYRHFYTPVMRDHFGRELLKRRFPLQSAVLFESTSFPMIDDWQPYYNLLDTIISDLPKQKCYEALVELDFVQVPAPFSAELVLEVTDKDKRTVSRSRATLHWLVANLNGDKRRFRLLTDPLPEEAHRIIVYIWNINKEHYILQPRRLRFAQLKGMGASVVIPEQFYRLFPDFSKAHL